MTTQMLERFRSAKEEELARLREECARGELPDAPYPGPRAFFPAALKRVSSGSDVAIVAEYKRASPSHGSINHTLHPEACAWAYAGAGAAAISVLTEARYFEGDLAFLQAMRCCGLPLLRKDVIFDALQVRETARTPASAVLVIARILGEAAFDDVLNACARCAIEPVVEVFCREDLARAQARDVRVIQVNNRDLDTLRVDVDTSRELIGCKRAGEIWISASGFDSHSAVLEMKEIGFDACLVGSHLMEQGDPGGALRELRGVLACEAVS